MAATKNMQDLASASSAAIQQVFLRASAPRLLQNDTDVEDEVDPFSLQGIWEALNDAMPLWAVWVVLIGGSFFICFLIAMCTCCVLSRRRKSKQRHSNKSSLSKYTNSNGHSARTMARKLDGTPSRALRIFKSPKAQPNNFVRMSDANDEDYQVTPNNRPVSRRVPESYGRVDEETSKRIQSIRMSVNMRPILAQQKPPSDKALRMMGITEDQSKKKFDETVQQRMKRIAAGAGGGVYAPGFATAGFGSSVVEGFAALRVKKEKKAAEKRLTMQQNESGPPPDFRNVKLKSTKIANQTRAPTISLNPSAPKLHQFLARNESADSDADADEKPLSFSGNARVPTKSVYGAEVDALKPGGNKMAAFLNSTAATSVDDSDDDDVDDNDSDFDDSIDDVL